VASYPASLEAMEKADAIIGRTAPPKNSIVVNGGSPLIHVPAKIPGNSVRLESDAKISAKIEANPDLLPDKALTLDGGPVRFSDQGGGIAISPSKAPAQPAATQKPVAATAARTDAPTSVAQSSPGGLSHTLQKPVESNDTSRVPLNFIDHFTRMGPIMVPKWDTIRGTPYALLQMAAAVFKAGPRATAMFLSCTIIFAVFWLRMANSGKAGYFIYMTAIFSPLCISLMVMCVQWVAEEALRTVGWALGLLTFVATQAAALSLLIGVWHVAKTPRELVEELEKFTH